MPAFSTFFRPLGYRSGVQLVVGSAAIGNGGAAATPTGTTSVHVAVPREKCKLVSLQILVVTAAAGGGAITAQAFKRASGASTALTATSDLTATQFTTLDKGYAFPITGTDAQTVFQKGDTLRVDVVAASTVTTQPQVVVVAEWAVMA